MKHARDSQRKRVYDSERALPWYGSDTIGDGSIGAIKPFVAQVWKWARKRGMTHIITPPRLKDGRGTSYARGGPYHVNLPRWARTYTIVLHELAHSLTVYDGTIAWHGPEFAALFLKFMKRWHPERKRAYDLLRASYRNHRVKTRVANGGKK